jgi:hypothetical protein
MFSADFFPTPQNVIEQILTGEDLTGKTVLEPSAGKGNIVDFCAGSGAFVIACENNPDLKKILQTKCKVIADDFLTVTSDQVSHIDFIVMNPPFSADEKHILHAYNIAPAGCKIISLCNYNTLNNRYTNERKELFSIVENYGTSENLGECFSNSERKTNVEIGLIKIQKPGTNYNAEFDGFFTDEDPTETQYNGIMAYNVVRDLVNRYVAAVKLYDEQLNTGIKMNNLLSGFYGEALTFSCTENGAPKLRNEFKKDLQKAGWKFIFDKMNMQKYATKGLKEDINKFVEQQTEIPFTMKNIYHMLDMVVQTAGQRMDKAILEVFDRVTEHHAENRHNIKGWKTNSHFLVGKKFILPYMINPAKEYGYTSGTYRSLKSSYDGTIPDFEKALCYITGTDYDTLDKYDDQKTRGSDLKTVRQSIDNNYYGDWYESHFFKYKGYKNGNMHFEFKDENIWAKFNSHVARLKGYPLYEGKTQTKYQDRQTGRAKQEKAKPEHAFKPTILFTAKVA